MRPDHGTTGRESSKVKVKRNGQITIPLGLRERFKIKEGSVLEVEAREQGILLKPAAPLEAGPVVGEEAHKRILRDLESLRKKWALTAVADAPRLLTLQFPPGKEIGKRVEEAIGRELVGRLLAPSIVLTEFVQIAGARIGICSSLETEPPQGERYESDSARRRVGTRRR